MNNPHDNLATALDSAERGYRCIPIVPGLKIPVIGWRRYQTESPTLEDYHAWFEGTRNNIAVVCGDLIIVDVDDMNEVDFVLGNCGKTEPMTRTPRGGIHLPYRARKGVHVPNHVEVKGHKIDLRALGGIAVIPHSQTEKGRYKWFGQGLPPLCDLPVFKVSGMRERNKRRLQSVVIESSPDVMVRRARAWLACVEGTITGQGGCHNKTFRIACKLTHNPPLGFGLTFEQAWPLFEEWSEIQCEPPWTDRELEHKLRDALKNR